MCYSAMVEQGVKKLERQFKARVDMGRFEQLFRRRTEDKSIKIAKGLEANFEVPASPAEERIKEHILAFRTAEGKRLEAELFKQKKRLADSERKLKQRETKKALEDQRISGYKVEWLLKKLAELKRTDSEPEDARIYPFWHAPVMIWDNGEYVIRPMRYHCRPNGKPASYDKRYPGLYNARRDNLEGFWKSLFGRRHAVCVVKSFYENVAAHDFEKRTLRQGEEPRNRILHFNPRPPMEMLVAGLWDRWQKPGAPAFDSFALITDEPPPEVAATGHNRCIIPLRAGNVQRWLQPEAGDLAALYALLDDRERPYYAHELAA